MNYLTLIKRVLDKNVAGLRKTTEIIGFHGSSNYEQLPTIFSDVTSFSVAEIYQHL
jgi:hypothetical protein